MVLLDSLMQLNCEFEENGRDYFLELYGKNLKRVISTINSLKTNGSSLEGIFELDNTDSADSITLDFAYDAYNALNSLYSTIG